MRAQIRRLEKTFGKHVEEEPLTRELIEWMVRVLVEDAVKQSCLEALGRPKKGLFEMLPFWSSLVGDPRVQAEVNRRLPVLRAWREWYRVKRAPYFGELQPDDWANWDWVISAVYCLRRDGTEGLPEAEILLRAADKAGVGTREEEKQRMVKLGLTVFGEHPDWLFDTSSTSED